MNGVAIMREPNRDRQGASGGMAKRSAAMSYREEALPAPLRKAERMWDRLSSRSFFRAS